MVLGKLPVPGRPTIWMIVGQGPIALAVGAGGGCLDIFTLLYLFSPLSPSLWETAQYRLRYCLKGPLNQKNNQSTNSTREKRLWENNCLVCSTMSAIDKLQFKSKDSAKIFNDMSRPLHHREDYKDFNRVEFYVLDFG